MRKFSFFLLALLLVVSITVYAHPGRTDANGGHTDRSTGEYHYHHGYEAHHHTNGQCPYDFDDKTGWSSGEPSSGSNHAQVTKPKPEDKQDENNSTSDDSAQSSVTTQNSQSSDSTTDASPTPSTSGLSRRNNSKQKITFSYIFNIIIGVLFFSYLAFLFVCFVIWIVKHIISRIDHLRKAKQRKEDEKNERQNYIAFFNGQSARTKANVPKEIVFDSNFWPTGDDQLRFVLNSNRHHKTTCRYAKGTNVLWHRVPSYSIPCKICRPVLPEHPQWLSDYRKYIGIKKKYKIPDPDIPNSGYTIK